MSFLDLIPQDKLEHFGYYRLQKDDIFVTDSKYCCLFRKSGSNNNMIEEVIISDDYGGVVSLTVFEAQNLFTRFFKEIERKRYNVRKVNN